MQASIGRGDGEEGRESGAARVLWPSSAPPTSPHLPCSGAGWSIIGEGESYFYAARTLFWTGIFGCKCLWAAQRVVSWAGNMCGACGKHARTCGVACEGTEGLAC